MENRRRLLPLPPLVRGGTPRVALRQWRGCVSVAVVAVGGQPPPPRRRQRRPPLPRAFSYRWWCPLPWTVSRAQARGQQHKTSTTPRKTRGRGKRKASRGTGGQRIDEAEGTRSRSHPDKTVAAAPQTTGTPPRTPAELAPANPSGDGSRSRGPKAPRRGAQSDSGRRAHRRVRLVPPRTLPLAACRATSVAARPATRVARHPDAAAVNNGPQKPWKGRKKKRGIPPPSRQVA